jgi:quercetin dioxygenase-like cupin family protein
MSIKIPLILALVWCCTACNRAPIPLGIAESASTPTLITDITAGADIKLIDVPAMVKKMGENKPRDTDISFPLQNSQYGSLHIHALGPTQRVPLHIHPHADEFTVIVSGNVLTRHWYEEADSLQHVDLEQVPGTLLQIPSKAGHEWLNIGSEFQANLVFSVPAFYGNLYLEDGDKKLLEGSTPTIVPPTLLQLQTGATSQLQEIGSSQVRAFLTKGQLDLESHEMNNYLYVSSGMGRFETDTKVAEIRQGHLLYLPAGTAASLITESQLRGYLFSL